MKQIDLWKFFVLSVGLTIALTSPALAECRYVSDRDHGYVTFSNEEIPLHGVARMILTGQGEFDCTLSFGDDIGDYMLCEGWETPEVYNFSSFVMGSGQNDLLVLWDHVWRRSCET